MYISSNITRGSWRSLWREFEEIMRMFTVEEFVKVR